ncbi:MAG: RNA polymerase sigma factor [Bacteriovoracaceae bacterium]|nr:RNA polymerase sigma factor [Bacteriovoracaceae bacterium]
MTDEELMLSYKEGDLGPFQVLYGRHKERLMGYLVKKLSDQIEAEEVFQTVFVKLHTNRMKYSKDIPFLPWFFTIARNVMIDHIRKRNTYKKYISVDTDHVNSYAANDKTESFSIGDSISELSSLSDSQRRALELRFDEGLSFGEIGKRMSSNSLNARQVVSRGVRALKSLIEVGGQK